MKAQRQSKLLRLIKEQPVETQDELAALLRADGFTVTQATISRDIRELRLQKTLTADGRYRYAEPGEDETAVNMGRLLSIFREGLLSFDSAMNIVVIKTMPSLAPAVCSALDSMHLSDMLGSIAGDDTAFLLLRDAKSAKLLCSKIKALLE